MQTLTPEQQKELIAEFKNMQEELVRRSLHSLREADHPPSELRLHLFEQMQDSEHSYIPAIHPSRRAIIGRPATKLKVVIGKLCSPLMKLFFQRQVSFNEAVFDMLSYTMVLEARIQHLESKVRDLEGVRGQ